MNHANRSPRHTPTECCIDCGGGGEVAVTRYLEGLPFEEDVECSRCEGTGKERGHCPSCGTEQWGVDLCAKCEDVDVGEENRRTLARWARGAGVER